MYRTSTDDADGLYPPPLHTRQPHRLRRRRGAARIVDNFLSTAMSIIFLPDEDGSIHPRMDQDGPKELAERSEASYDKFVHIVRAYSYELFVHM